MRRAILGCAAAAALMVPAPASANEVTRSVSSTLYAACVRNAFTVAACNGLITSAAAALSTIGAGQPLSSWLQWFSLNDWVKPYPLSGSFGGAGASGSWDCEDFQWRTDAAGNLIVPSIPLSPNTSLLPKSTTATGNNYFMTGGLGSTFVSKSKLGENSVLWAVHKINATTSEKRRWLGVWGKDTNGIYQFSSQAYFNTSGLFVQRTVVNTGPTITTISIDCPPQGVTDGGDFHFYVQEVPFQTPSCHFYAPNFQLSKSGYAYPEIATISLGQVPDYVKGLGSASYCNVTPDVIRKIAEELWGEAYEKDQTLPPPAPVLPEDVRTTPEPPNVEDIYSPPGNLPPADPAAQPPAPTPTPSPTPTSGPDYSDPGIGQPSIGDPPTGIMDPIFDWLPDLPSINIDVGAVTCPTWQMQPFPGPEWALTLDSHCPFIESNRAALGALFLVLFSIGAALIILRA